MNIEEVINRNADLRSIQRGKAIFKKRGVLKLTSNGSSSYVAEVSGTSAKPYKLHFSLTAGGVLSSFCSCPYDWGGICKHMIAALYCLEANVNGNRIKQISPQSVIKKEDKKENSSGPYKMSMSDMDNLQNLKESDEYTVAEKMSMRIGVITFDKSKIIIQVPNQYYFDNGTTVNIRPSKNQLLISSKPIQKVEKPTIYELAALIYLQKSQLTHLFDLFDKQKSDVLLLNEAKRYGINDISTANEYFELIANNVRRPFQLKKQYNNLLPLSEHRIGFVNALRDVTGGENNREGMLLASSPKKWKKNPISIRFAFESEVLHQGITIITLLPFVCKIKADGSFYKTNLKPLDEVNSWSNYYPELTDQEYDLVSLSEKFGKEAMNERFTKTWAELNEEQSQLYALEQNLNALQKLWPKLQKQGNVFFLRSDEYYNYGIQAEDLKSVTIIDETPRPVLEIDTINGFIVLTAKLEFSFGTLEWDGGKINFHNKIFGTVDGKVFLLSSAEAAIVIDSFFYETSSLRVSQSDFHGLFKDIIRPLSKYMDIRTKKLPPEISEETSIPIITSKKVYLKELDHFILIKPIVEYGAEGFNILEDQPTMRLEANTIVHLKRNLEEEQAFLETVREFHPSFSKENSQEFFHLRLEEFIQDYWFLTFSEKLKEENVEVYGFNDFKNFQYAPSRPTVSVKLTSGEDWFDVDIQVLVGDTRIGLKDLKKALISKDKYIRLGDGKLAVLPTEWIEKLQRYLRIGKIEKDGLKISKLKFNVVDELFEGIDDQEILKEIGEKRKRLLEFSGINKISLPKVDAKLRDYQKEGYQWLHFLHEFGWGGILADDMGLGKTLQIITFLRFLKSNKVKNNLIVMPTTLLFNWKVELENFCPTLRFYIHHGNDRDKQKIDWKKYDLIITTYGMIASDIKLFSKQEFGYVILDESQAIKNPASKRFKAVNVLKAKNRLALTGTPIENNTFDLYAQMSFVNPGLFISAEAFRKDYAIPIDKNGDKKAAAELNRIIHPFMLRRTKEMVATELPPKIEDVIYCNMGTAQRKVYDAHRNEYRNNILGLIEEKGLAKSKLHVLQALTKLRQVCDSPALLKGEESYDDESVKIKELIRHIQEKTGNHKLLIFSQFVKMLSLIKKELDRLDIDYSYLDGKSSQKSRKKAVDDFQDNKNIRVFLISLKAGGTGINLTAADYVYIVDPWWNPAVENQAIDRCYRIGQDKKVIAYRMICKDTIEEKIMNYKSRKQAVADAIIQTDENIMKKISKDDIMDLFA